MHKEFFSIKYSTGVGHLIVLFILSYQWLLLIGFKHQNLFVVKYFFKILNKIILFHIENSERFILYCLCGCFIGIAIILLMIIIVLYIGKGYKKTVEPEKIKSDYQIPRNDINYNDILSTTHCYLPVYRYDGRSQSELYNI